MPSLMNLSPECEVEIRFTDNTTPNLSGLAFLLDIFVEGKLIDVMRGKRAEKKESPFIPKQDSVSF